MHRDHILFLGLFALGVTGLTIGTWLRRGARRVGGLR